MALDGEQARDHRTPDFRAPDSRATPDSRAGAAPGADSRTAAQLAAAALPTATEAAQATGESRGERAFGVVLGVATFVGFSIWALVFVTTQLPYGWLVTLAGLPTWLLARALFFRISGSETATCTVDDDGVIHVLTGHTAIGRLARMYDVGATRWIGRGVVVGAALGVLVPVVPAVIAVALDSPTPIAVFLILAAFCMLDLVRYVAVIALGPRWTGRTRLDSAAMLPAMAIYARHHGWRAAVSGLPADKLMETLAAHPDEVETARTHETLTKAIDAFGRRTF